jgi:hypothetical protein
MDFTIGMTGGYFFLERWPISGVKALAAGFRPCAKSTSSLPEPAVWGQSDGAVSTDRMTSR